MSKEAIQRLAALVIAGSLFMDGQSHAASSPPTFAIGEMAFLLDSQPFVIRSGEMHYPRIPREYWAHRLRMARALGLNTVSTYVFWNLHEPHPGQFDFTGNADVAEFCRLARREGLKVILRPGPYVCGEWDFGGLPWWLLRNPDVRVRTRHPVFMEACQRYFKELGKQLAPLQITKGGPIIMVQVENEYDSFGRDSQYIAALSTSLKEAGFEVPFFSSEMGSSMVKDSHGDILRTVGLSRDPEKHFTSLRAIQPTGPLMSGELYTGWFARWGSPSGSGDNYTNLTEALDWMLDRRVSFNLYMAHGGTSFGFTAGANSGAYLPNPTSYDYGAPISEAGWPTPKYFAIRELLSTSLAPGEALAAIPPTNPIIRIPSIALTEMAPVFENLPEPKKVSRPRSMESFDQPHGCILYRTQLQPGGGERLSIRELHDYAWVFLDGQKLTMLDRGRKRTSVVLPARTNEMTLDLLVEGMGRINFGDEMHDRKGITEKVELIKGRSPQELRGWEVFNLPLYDRDLAALKFRRGATNLPAFFRGRFNLSEVGDTFLAMNDWGKGVAWVNGHNLGRFWAIGPQQTLYCPGPWLKRGANEIVVLELNGAEKHSVEGFTQPTLNFVNHRATGRLHREPNQVLRLEGVKPHHTGTFPPTQGWQTAKFEPVLGRYLCFEALNSQGGDGYTTCAELGLIRTNGSLIPRNGWKVVYANSEEVGAEDGSAVNALDALSDTYWHSQWDAAKPKPPHQIVVDLGREELIAGLQYLPRQDLPNGHIKDYQVFISSAPLLGQ